MNDWDAYRVFLAVATHGSFSRAAAELRLSQPTASRRVDDLEKSLGTRLLVRRARGVVPTPAGERILDEIRRMATSASSIARMTTGETHRMIRISATEGYGTLWLPHRVAALRELDPKLTIEIVIDNAAIDLAGRQADIAIRLFRPRQPDLVAKRVGTVEFGFYASRAYLDRHGTPRRLADLQKHDHVGFVDRGIAVPSYMRWLRELIPTERFVVSASSLLAMSELARAGVGIVLGTVPFLEHDRSLVRLLPRVRPPSMEIWLAVHADVRRDRDVARVLERLGQMV